MNPPCDPCAPAIDCPVPDDFALYSLTDGANYAVVTPPPAGAPCSGCGAPIDCSGGLNNPDSSDYAYTLTGDPTLPWFFLCPTGYSCRPPAGTSWPIYLDCCGHTLSRTISSTTTNAQLSSLWKDMLIECQSFAGECSNPPTGPGSEPPGGGGSGGGGGGGTPPTTVYWNQPIQCDSLCPDGTAGNPITIPPGTSLGRTQAIANATALNLCKHQSSAKLICFGRLKSSACLNVLYDEILPMQIGAGVTAPLVYAGSGFPTGINVSDAAPAFPNSASVFGTPTVAGNSTGKIQVTSDNGITASKQFTINVLGLTSGTWDAGTKIMVQTGGLVNSPYSLQLTADGGTGPYTFTNDPDLSPSWVSLSSDGLITGTPDSPADYQFEVTVTDSLGQSCSTMISIDVVWIRFTNGQPPDGVVCTPYSFTFTAVPPGCTFTGTCPAGLTLASNGVVSGKQTSIKSNTFVITAHDGAGHTETKTWTITITNSGLAASAQDIVWTDSFGKDADPNCAVSRSGDGILVTITAHGDCVSGSMSSAWDQIVGYLRNCTADSYSLQIAVSFAIPDTPNCGSNPYPFADVTIYKDGIVLIDAQLGHHSSPPVQTATTIATGLASARLDIYCRCRGNAQAVFTITLSPATPP